MTLTESGTGGTTQCQVSVTRTASDTAGTVLQSSTVPAAVGTALWYDGGLACAGSLPTGSGKTLLVRITICHLCTDHDELLIAVVCEKSNTKREDAAHAYSAKRHCHLPV